MSAVALTGAPQARLALLAAAGAALATALAVLPLEVALLLALALPGTAVVALRPRWLLYALPLLVPIAYEAALPLGGSRLGVHDLAIAGAAVGWLALSVARRRVEVELQPIGWLLLAWLWAQLLSQTGALSLGAGLAEMAKWVEVLAVYVLVLALLRRAPLWPLAYAVAAAGAASALLGLFQFATGRGPEGFLLLARFMRAYGTFQQPNPFAGHLGLSLPFALGWALAATDRPRRERLAMLACAGLMALGILASWSRGAWVALAVSVALMGLLLAPRLALAAGAVGLALALLFGGGDLAGPLVERVVGMSDDVRTLNVSQVEVTDANWSVVERLAHWQAGWYMFAAKPWLGVGAGNYEAVYSLYSLPRWRDPLGHAHNFYLNVAAETGLVGLSAFAALGLGALAAMARGWRRARAGSERAILVAAAGALAYLSVHSAVDNLFVHAMQVIVGLCLAILALSAWARTSQPEGA